MTQPVQRVDPGVHEQVVAHDVARIFVTGLLARVEVRVVRTEGGVEPRADSLDRLRQADQLQFNRWLADEAHRRGLSVGLKNDLPQATDLVDWFDWVLVEECVEFDECSGVAPFVAAGKAAFGTEYSEPNDRACDVAAEFGITLLFKDLNLGAVTTSCP